MHALSTEGLRSLGVLLEPHHLPLIPGRPSRTRDPDTGLLFACAQEKKVTAIFNGPLVPLGVTDTGVEMLFLPRFQTNGQKEGQTDIADGILSAIVRVGDSVATENVAFVPTEAIVGKQSILRGRFPEDMRTVVVGDTIRVGFTVAGLDGNPYPAYAEVNMSDIKAGVFSFKKQEVITQFGMGKNAMPVQPLDPEYKGEPILAFRPEIAPADGCEVISFIQKQPNGGWEKIQETKFPANMQGRSGLVGSEMILAPDGTHRMVFHKNEKVDEKTGYELTKGKVEVGADGTFKILAIDPDPLVTPAILRRLTGDRRQGAHHSKEIVYAVGSIYDVERQRFLVAITYADQVTYLVEVPESMLLRSS